MPRRISQCSQVSSQKCRMNPRKSNKNAQRGALPANELKTLPRVCLCDCPLHRCFYYPIYNECLNKGSFNPLRKIKKAVVIEVYSIVMVAHRLVRK
jgi:hypothetical protein